MEREPRSTPLLTITTCCLLLIPPAYAAAFLAAYTTPYKQFVAGTPWFSNSSENRGQDDSFKFLLARLVTGGDREKLEASGFACDVAPHSVVCVANQQVKIEITNLKVHVRSCNQSKPQIETMVQPYARQEDNALMSRITPVDILVEKTTSVNICNHTHSVPVIVFSSGLMGNLFHEISEIVIPLFITARHFRSGVQFMITDYQPWFAQKYKRLLKQLSRYQVIDANISNTSVHCFPGAVVGLKYHGNLALDPDSIPGGHTMVEFREFLRETYGLKVKNANEIQKPTLLLISRKRSRTFENEDAMVGMMEEMGFQVMITKTKEMLNVDEFSQVVNSCNVIVGAHGAGLTNAIFLPQGAVIVQVVPYALTWASDTYFRQPTMAMGLKYLEYKVEADESSLIRSYGPDDPVIADPVSLFSRGYEAVRAIYVDGQNMTIDLSRFRATLDEALTHLTN